MAFLGLAQLLAVTAGVAAFILVSAFSFPFDGDGGRAVASNRCSLGKDGTNKLSDWLNRLQNEKLFDAFQINGERIDDDTLYICTEDERGSWFQRQWEAKFYPPNLVVIGRDLIEVGLLRDPVTDVHARPGALLFVLLHEIGHYQTHGFPEIRGMSPPANSDRIANRIDEIYADCWAGLHAEHIGFSFYHEYEYAGALYETKMNISNVRSDLINLAYEPPVSEGWFWQTSFGAFIKCALFEPCVEREALGETRHSALLNYLDTLTSITEYRMQGVLGESQTAAIANCAEVRLGRK